MQRIALDKSLKDFSFEIHYLNNPVDIEHIGDANYEDIIYVRCYPKWNISEQELYKSIQENKSLILTKMREVSNKHDLFYCYFDIDFSFFKGTTAKIVDNKVRWIEARPEIKKKNIDDHPKGFINPVGLPPEN